MDEYNQVVGVCQAINKRTGYFTKNDEGFLAVLANLAGVVLKNSISFDQEKIFHQTIRAVLNSGIYINSLGDLNDIILVSEKKLVSIMGTSAVKILIADRKKGAFLHFRANQITDEYPIESGLAGKVLASGKYEVLSNAYYDSNFNGLIDIETTLPLVIWPIKDPNDETEVIGIIEAINLKGVEGLSAVHKPKLSPYDLETIDLFSKQLCRAVKNNTSNKNLNFSIFANHK